MSNFAFLKASWPELHEAATLVAQVYLLGLNLVYLRVTEGLDTGSTEAALSQGFDQARRRAAELGHKAKEVADRAREQARQAAAAANRAAAPPAAAAPMGLPEAANPPVPQAAVASICPSCHAAVTADDMFCGVCRR